MKVIKFGDINKEDIKNEIKVKDKKQIAKLPIPLEALTYPKNDTKMKSAATNLLNELKGRTQKMGQVMFLIVIT